MSRPATSVQFGFNFQTNAAIVLMLENMAEMETVRVEGKEDIEIQLNDESYVLAQAKSVEKSSTDFNNVRANAKKAIKTLSESAQGINVRDLIYITNSPNPFKDDSSKPDFYGRAHKKYDELPQSTKDIITSFLSDIKMPLDTRKFEIQVLPFESDDDRQRYRVVLEEISDFIGELDISADGLRKRLHEVWSSILTKNGTRKDESLKINKKDVIWPVIVFVTGKGELNREAQYCNFLDDAIFDEVNRKYGELIDYYSERYDVASKIIADFTASERNGRDAITSFINEHWEDYQSDLGIYTLETDIRSNLMKIIMYTVLKKRFDINKIKRIVNL